MSGAKSTKKNRKVGRNANYCLRYRNSGRQERNKLVRIKKHLMRFPADTCATKAMEALK